MPGPCPGTWCIGNCVELDRIEHVESDATTSVFRVRVLQHCNSTIGNPDECHPDGNLLLSGFDLIVHFAIRGVPGATRNVHQCIRELGFAPNAFTFEFAVDTPANETDAPITFTAESVLEGGKTGRTTAARTTTFTVQPDGTVEPPPDGGDGDGDGDGDAVDKLTELIERIGTVGVIILLIVLAFTFRDLAGGD